MSEERISIEWLESLGFKRANTLESNTLRLEVDVGDCSFNIDVWTDWKPYKPIEDWRWLLSNEHDTESVQFPSPDNRNEVMRLLSVLKVPGWDGLLE